MTRKCACGCGKRFGLINHKYYTLRFATKLCLERYKHRVDDAAHRKRRWLAFLYGEP